MNTLLVSLLKHMFSYSIILTCCQILLSLFLYTEFDVNGELHWKSTLKKLMFDLSRSFVFLLTWNKHDFLFNKRRRNNCLIYISYILMFKQKFFPGSAIVLFNSDSVMTISILSLYIAWIKVGKAALVHEI